MTLYVDSAEREDVERLLDTGLFAGIATNPTLLERAGLKQDAHQAIYGWATAAGAKRIFFQARGTSVEEVVAMGHGLRAIGEQVVVKIPATAIGLAAASRLNAAQVPTLITAVYHSSQALAAVAVGADYIAPYVGRMHDRGRDGVLEASAMATIVEQDKCRVLAASLRSPDQVAALAVGGVQDFALSVTLSDKILSDPLTLAAAEEFEAAGRV